MSDELWRQIPYAESDKIIRDFYYSGCSEECVKETEILGRHYGKDVEYWDHSYFVVDDTGAGIPAPWFIREKRRMNFRKLPVWTKEYFWERHKHIHDLHFLHVSEKDPRLLAFTPDADRGVRDIQTPIRPGRYLNLFFKDILSPKKIAALAAWQISGTYTSDLEGVELHIATTCDDIAWVYINGPSSCMSGKNFDDVTKHPSRVYASDDLAIAYIKNSEGKPIARCLIWPDKKIASRVYPTPDGWNADGYKSWHESADIQDTLRYKLKQEGYTFLNEDDELSLSGARLLKIPVPNVHTAFLMPFIDGEYNVKDCGDHWVLTDEDGDYSGSGTEGYCGEDFFCFCQRCGGSIRREEDSCAVIVVYNSSFGHDWKDWCQGCCDSHGFFCVGADATVDEDIGYEEIEGDKYCLPWLEQYGFKSDYSGDWFVDSGERVTMSNGDVWSIAELEKYGFTCSITRRRFPLYEQHPDHNNIWEGVSDEELAAYLDSRKKAVIPSRRRKKK